YLSEGVNMAGEKAIILVEDNYEDPEFWYPYYRLKEEGFEVTIVAPEKKRTYGSKHGYPVISEATPEEINIDDIAVVVVPGGFAPDRLRRYDSILELLRAADRNGAVIASICHAAWVAISAGITKGRRMTCVKAIKDDLVNSGANFVDEALVIDGNMVTSRTPADLPVFVKGIIDAIKPR
ncbi:MAG: type 1 glutamine amidotransferase, partial [Spirochaetales bacterium]|nr:type 1 glutamine amidotransferase [Spirochaetales bacterium]